jgi:hypothetical protein
LLSGVGLLFSVAGWCASFFPLSVDKILPWSLVLLAGFLVDVLTVLWTELPQSKRGWVSHDQLTRDMPDWVGYAEIAVFLFGAANLLWFAYHSGGGVPAIAEGQFVSEARGHIFRMLSGTEYVQLQRLELRFFASIFTGLYCMLTMYWWFHRGHGHKPLR